MIQKRWFLALVVLILAASVPDTASAQDATVKRDSAIARLRTGQQIRISGEAMRRLIGKAGVAADDTLDFAQDDAVRRIPIPAIDSLWVRGGDAELGAVMGGGIGGLAALIYRGLAGSCETVDCGATSSKVVGTFFIGAAVGATLGALIGGSTEGWRLKFP